VLWRSSKLSVSGSAENQSMGMGQGSSGVEWTLDCEPSVEWSGVEC